MALVFFGLLKVRVSPFHKARDTGRETACTFKKKQLRFGMTSIFEKIIKKEIPAKIVFEDELCLAFHDIAPQAPTHIILIPKTTEIDRIANATTHHQDLLGHLVLVAADIAKEQKLKDYRLVINNGESAGQSVFHLHLHILGGRDFGWPPG